MGFKLECLHAGIIYESMINLRPAQNRSMQILDGNVRVQVKAVMNKLLGGEGCQII